MLRISKGILQLASVGLLCVAAVAATNPCLKEGKTDIPANPNLQSPGIPVGSQVVGGPEWYDIDAFANDHMGSGNPLTVENKNGNISGPNGEVVNGGLDGDCIELMYKVKLRYKMSVTVTVEPGGIGGSGTVEVWAERWFWFDHGEWCPC